jgi:hypothetical protein
MFACKFAEYLSRNAAISFTQVKNNFWAFGAFCCNCFFSIVRLNFFKIILFYFLGWHALFSTPNDLRNRQEHSPSSVNCKKSNCEWYTAMPKCWKRKMGEEWRKTMRKRLIFIFG